MAPLTNAGVSCCRCCSPGKELQVIGEQYPFEPLQYLRKTLKLTFAEGIQMLTDAGYEVSPSP